MRKVTIKLKNKNYTIAFNQRSKLLYEKFPDKSPIEFQQNQMCEFIFCSLQANNKEKFKLTYNQFLDCLDEDTSILETAIKIFLPEDTATEIKEQDSKN